MFGILLFEFVYPTGYFIEAVDTRTIAFRINKKIFKAEMLHECELEAWKDIAPYIILIHNSTIYHNFHMTITIPEDSPLKIMRIRRSNPSNYYSQSLEAVLEGYFDQSLEQFTKTYAISKE